jgi:hypothetical protein
MAQSSGGSELPRNRDLKLLAFAIGGGALLIFIGLVLISLAVLATSTGNSVAATALADRRVHYVLIALLVAFYVYMQRR